MGTYSDLHLHFTFRPGTPVDVLAAFSPLVVDTPHGRGAPAPTLPAPAPEPWEGWIPDYRDAYEIDPGDPDIDPIADEPWRHHWAPHLGGEMSWGSERWHYRTLMSFKADHYTIHGFIQWLGPFVESRHSTSPAFAGHIVVEYAPRPFLLMGVGDELVLEDTNPPGTYIY